MSQVQTTVPQTKFDAELDQRLKQSETLNEEIGLLQRLREIELSKLGYVENEANKPSTTPAAVKAPVNPKPQVAVAAATPTPTGDAPKRRGRPPGSTNKAKVPSDGKTINLPSLLETIAQQMSKPLKIDNFVTLVNQSGYESKAKDLSNMIYQSLTKLVKKGRFKKNDETREYEYVNQAA